MSKKPLLAAVVVQIVLLLLCDAVLLADPVQSNAPPVFCLRITDVEQVALGDGTPGNDFAISMEILNWSDSMAGGF
ncbi:MAG: hypothetical protein AAF456_12405 [Planctomycetota bacterium]